MNSQTTCLHSNSVSRSHDIFHRSVLTVLCIVLATYVIGSCLDFFTSVRYPFELDYGEGIVWQQAALMLGPRMYSDKQDLPFIVFHYPPFYHLSVRAVSWLLPDLLAAGRLVSAASTIAVAPLITGLVLMASRHSGQPQTWIKIGCAVVAGLLALCLPAIRTWGMFMRVDMLAVALSLAGLMLGAMAKGGYWRTSAALLCCVASVFTKQTQLTAGIAIFLMALLLNARHAVAAAVTAGTVGLGALGLLEYTTSGGFLRNIIGYNLNRWSVDNLLTVFWFQQSTLTFVIVMFAAFAVIGRGLLPTSIFLKTTRQKLPEIFRNDSAVACRALLLLEFILTTLTLVTTLKSGSNYNYLIEWLVVGCILIGVLLADLAHRGKGSGRTFGMVAVVLAVGVMRLPLQYLQDRSSVKDFVVQAALVQRIAKADRPVASENMTLLMRAGKPIIFEPAIATELALVGRWNEGPLVGMIRGHGFAFMVTVDNDIGGSALRTPAVDAAMREAYPRVEQAGPGLWLNLPAS